MSTARRADGLMAWGPPAPLPDELGISLIARYLRNWGYLDRSSLLRQLFGDVHRIVHGACPPLPRVLTKSLRLPGQDAALQFLRLHTLVPYLLSSMPWPQARATAIHIAGVDDRALYAALHLQSLGSMFSSHLQFCQACAASDIDSYGEPYWHRIHQIRGISHCPMHRDRLLRTEVPFSAHTADQLLAASTVIQSQAEFAPVVPLFDLGLEDIFSKCVAKTLQRRRLGTSQQRSFIKLSLLRLGYRQHSHTGIAVTRLADDLDQFLHSHGCRLESFGHRKWYLNMFRIFGGTPTPLQHHVFSIFLLDQFRTPRTSSRPYVSMIGIEGG